jgi:hypothetical protein
MVRPGPPRVRSQVFSTSQRFPGTSGLRGLVSCRCRPWGSPFRALLLAGIACASRRRLLPCSSPPPYLRCDARDLVLRVSPTPTPCDAVAWFPAGARPPFPSFSPSRCRALERPAPHALAHGPSTTSPTIWTHAPESPRSGGFGCFEAFLPPRVRAHGAPLSRTHRRRCSPGLCPSRALIRSSLGPSHDPADHSVRRGLVTAVAEGATPRRQVKPDDLAAAATSSAPDPQGDCGPVRAASRRQPCLPRPWSRRSAHIAVRPASLVLGGVKDLDQHPTAVLPVAESALLGFRASSAASRLREPTSPLASRRAVSHAPCATRLPA